VWSGEFGVPPTLWVGWGETRGESGVFLNNTCSWWGGKISRGASRKPGGFCGTPFGGGDEKKPGPPGEGNNQGGVHKKEGARRNSEQTGVGDKQEQHERQGGKSGA